MTMDVPLDDILGRVAQLFRGTAFKGTVYTWKSGDTPGYGRAYMVLDATRPGRDDAPEHVMLIVETSPGSKMLHANACLEESGKIIKLEVVRYPTPEEAKVHAENLIAWWREQIAPKPWIDRKVLEQDDGADDTGFKPAGKS
jgi:hypothetical protein